MIVLPMAGLSSRFTQAGYEQPKFMLPLWGGTVFDHAVSSFRGEFDRETLVFIYRETGSVREFLDARLDRLGVRRRALVRLDHETAGQAETVEIGLDQADGVEGALTIFNIDSFRHPKVALPTLDRGSVGNLEIFEGEGDNWSFVEAADDGRTVVRTTEKVPISNLCSDGLYQFASIDLFRSALTAERAEPSSRELYIAPIYNHLIASGERVTYSSIPRDAIVFCGVPDEYEELRGGEPPWPISQEPAATSSNSSS
ncbi:capsular biosynthesis protein [Sphingomicrobium sp. XHP0239]|uniref:capsular biosynthesis protein n=1 Tax=Sphingomicrobium maritimum TaxID=3133972 RepID=UPI0031CCCF6F